MTDQTLDAAIQSVPFSDDVSSVRSASPEPSCSASTASSSASDSGDVYVNAVRERIDRLNSRLAKETATMQRVKTISDELRLVNNDIRTIKTNLKRNSKHISDYETRLKLARDYEHEQTNNLDIVHITKQTLINELDDLCGRPTVTDEHEQSPLERAYNTSIDCTVCRTTVRGESIVHLGSCSHSFCIDCVERAAPLTNCMLCRSQVTRYYHIVREGSLFRIVCNDVDWHYSPSSPVTSPPNGFAEEDDEEEEDGGRFDETPSDDEARDPNWNPSPDER